MFLFILMIAALSGGLLSFLYYCLGFYPNQNLKLQFFLYGKFSCSISYQEHNGLQINQNFSLISMH